MAGEQGIWPPPEWGVPEADPFDSIDPFGGAGLPVVAPEPDAPILPQPMQEASAGPVPAWAQDEDPAALLDAVSGGDQAAPDGLMLPDADTHPLEEADPEFANPAPFDGGAMGAPEPQLATDEELTLEAPGAAPEPFAEDDGISPDAVMDPYSADSRRLELEGMTDEERSDHFVKQEAARQAEEARLRQEAHNRDLDAREENLRLLERAQGVAKAKTDAIIRDAEILAKKEPDDTRWFGGGAGGGSVRVIGSFMAAAFGGVAAARTGKNEALDGILGMVDRDIKQQMNQIKRQGEALDLRRNAVAQEYQRTGDLMRAKETVRLAHLSRLDEKVAAQMVQYDPEGTTARRMFEMRQELAAKKQEAAENIQAQQRKNALELLKQQRAQEKHDSDMDTALMNRQKTAMDISKGGLDVRLKQRKLRGSGPARRMPAQYWEAMYPTLKGKLPEGATFSQKEFDQYLARKKKITDMGGDTVKAGKARAEFAKAEAEAANAQEARERLAKNNPYALPGKKRGTYLTNKNGETFEFTDEKTAKEFRDDMTRSQIARDIVDDLKILRTNHGGAWGKVIKTAEYQRIIARVKKLDMQNAVHLKLGAISADDLVQLEGYRGGADPTSFLENPIPGLEAMANLMEDDMNRALDSATYTGERWETHKKHAAGLKEQAPEAVLDEVGKPLRRDKAATPEGREEEIGNKVTSIEHVTKHRKVSPDFIRKTARGIEAMGLAPEERERLYEPLFKAYVRMNTKAGDTKAERMSRRGTEALIFSKPGDGPLGMEPMTFDEKVELLTRERFFDED